MATEAEPVRPSPAHCEAPGPPVKKSSGSRRARDSFAGPSPSREVRFAQLQGGSRQIEIWQVAVQDEPGVPLALPRSHCSPLVRVDVRPSPQQLRELCRSTVQPAPLHALRVGGAVGRAVVALLAAVGLGHPVAAERTVLTRRRAAVVGPIGVVDSVAGGGHRRHARVAAVALLAAGLMAIATTRSALGPVGRAEPARASAGSSTRSGAGRRRR